MLKGKVYYQMIRNKVTENHQDTKFWPNLHSFIGKWKIALFLDDTVGEGEKLSLFSILICLG